MFSEPQVVTVMGWFMALGLPRYFLFLRLAMSSFQYACVKVTFYSVHILVHLETPSPMKMGKSPKSQRHMYVYVQ